MNLAPFTRETIRTIRLNAGKFEPEVLAEQLGMSLSHLVRVAREHKIDLRPPIERVEDPRAPTGSAHDPTPHRVLTRKPNPRTEYVSAAFTAADVALMDMLANEFGIKRSRVITRVIENARARDLLFDLARLPAPLPEKAGNLDE